MRRAAVGLLLAIAAARAVSAAPAAPPHPTEHEVKAAFLYHFAQLVEWPNPAEGRPLVIAVAGRDPFGPVLERTIGRETVRGRPVRIVRPRGPGEAAEPIDILFLGDAGPEESEQWMALARKRPVLTVSERRRFAETGGMIQFRLTEDGRVGFDINLEEARRAELKLSSQLLKLARIVERRR
jgi:hypothetical protein